MPTVIQNKFDGGHAEDIRTFNTDECEKSLNFDLYTNPHKLLPYRDVKADMSVGSTDNQFDGVVFDGSLYWTVGQASSGSNVPKFYSKSNIQDAWSAQNSGPAGSTVVKGTLVLYKGNPYVLAYDSSFKLILVDKTGSAVTGTPSSVANMPQTYIPRPFVHPEDNILYMVFGKVIGKYDGTTYSEVSTILPTDAVDTGLTEYGTYLAIGCITGGKSVVFLWGRDTTVNTLQGTLPFGESILIILESIGNQLVGICISSGSLAGSVLGRLDVKVYGGGSVETVKSLSFNAAVVNYNTYKTKYNQGLYFGFGSDDSIYVVKKNNEGRWSISKDRYIFNGTTTGSASPIPVILSGFLFIGFASQTTPGQFYRTGGAPTESNAYTATSKYLTTINPSMLLADRYKNKQLEAVRISFTGKPNGTVAVKYLVDGVDGAGNTVMTTNIISQGTTAIETVIEATNESDGTQLLAGRELQFQLETTGGVEIKEFEYRYSVINSAS